MLSGWLQVLSSSVCAYLESGRASTPHGAQRLGESTEHSILLHGDLQSLQEVLGSSQDALRSSGAQEVLPVELRVLHNGGVPLCVLRA